MADKPKKKKRRALFGLAPLEVFAASSILGAFGLLGVVALDLIQPDHDIPAKHEMAGPSHQAPSPTVRDIRGTADKDESPSILTRRDDESETVEIPPAPVTEAAELGPEENAAPPMLAFAAPAKHDAKVAALAIVIDDMGLDRARSLEVLKLPAPLTVSLMTYANNLNNLSRQARAAGHEVMGHVPMQPHNTDIDPGPNPLTVSMDEIAIRIAIGEDLDDWTGYVGINNHMGSLFTEDPKRMAIVMSELKGRGLLWLDSRTTGDTVGPEAAQEAGVPHVARDVFLDNVDSMPEILKELEQVIAIAKKQGTAIAIGHPRDATIRVLREVLRTLENRGVTLVPVTEILRRKQGAIQPSRFHRIGVKDSPARCAGQQVRWRRERRSSAALR